MNDYIATRDISVSLSRNVDDWFTIDAGETFDIVERRRGTYKIITTIYGKKLTVYARAEYLENRYRINRPFGA